MEIDKYINNLIDEGRSKEEIISALKAVFPYDSHDSIMRRYVYFTRPREEKAE